MKQSESTPAELAALFDAIFSVDGRGRQILEHLERRFCSASPVVTEGGVDAILKTYQRAAHREVLDYIHTMIARHSAPPSETPIANI